MKFEYPEDREFFANLLAGGDIKRLEEEFSDYFNFEHPAIKRWEFNKFRNKLMPEILEKYGGQCQLRLHPDCSKNGIYQIDHIIPLSSNELNKKLRHMGRTSKEKVPTQSFGSNNLKNLTLACKRCNAYKMHRLMLPKSFDE